MKYHMYMHKIKQNILVYGCEETQESSTKAFNQIQEQPNLYARAIRLRYGLLKKWQTYRTLLRQMRERK